MQLINWALQEKIKHPYVKERKKELQKYNKRMKLVKPKNKDENK